MRKSMLIIMENRQKIPSVNNLYEKFQKFKNFFRADVSRDVFRVAENENRTESINYYT